MMKSQSTYILEIRKTENCVSEEAAYEMHYPRWYQRLNSSLTDLDPFMDDLRKADIWEKEIGLVLEGNK